MSEEKKPLVRDGAKATAHREPRGVSKPRVGNPWRDSVQGPVGAPTMRVRGGAPSGMPTPSWQADGYREGFSRALVLPAMPAPCELSSVVRAYALDDATMTYALPSERDASLAWSARRPAASPAESRALPSVSREKVAKAIAAYDPAKGKGVSIDHGRDVLWVDGDKRAREHRAAYELAQWEVAYSKALQSGHCTLESLPAHPSVVAARFRALAATDTPDTVRVREVPRAGVANDPTLDTRVKLRLATERTLSGGAPSAARRHDAPSGYRPILDGTRPTAARDGIHGGLHTGGVSSAVRPCSWCGSVACVRAIDPVRPCPIYERAVTRKVPQAVAYAAARDAHKAPKRAMAEAHAWLSGERERIVCAIKRLDSLGVSIERDPSAGAFDGDSIVAPRADTRLVKGTDGECRMVTTLVPQAPVAWPPSPDGCHGRRVGNRLALQWHRAAHGRSAMEGCHQATILCSVLSGALDKASDSKTDTDEAVLLLSMVSGYAPRGSWWPEFLPSWVETNRVLNGREGALVAHMRDAHRKTGGPVARVLPATVRDAPVPTLDVRASRTPAGAPSRAPHRAPMAPALATTVAPVPTSAPPPKRPVAPDAPRTPLPLVVGATSPVRRVYTDAPAYDTRPRTIPLPDGE